MSSAKGGNDDYFSHSKRGEISDWRNELNNEKESVRKEAVKKVIAAMTVGKDVSMLFPDIVKSVQTNNVELKKLVYLYIMNYAKTQPDLAILAVNTFKNVQNIFFLCHHLLLAFSHSFFSLISFFPKNQKFQKNSHRMQNTRTL